MGGIEIVKVLEEYKTNELKASKNSVVPLIRRIKHAFHNNKDVNLDFSGIINVDEDFLRNLLDRLYLLDFAKWYDVSYTVNFINMPPQARRCLKTLIIADNNEKFEPELNGSVITIAKDIED